MFCTSNNMVQESYTIVNMKIAENIKFYRTSLGLTQKELAKFLNGEKSLISNYENGYSTPDIYRLVELADVFKISLDELVGRELK